MKIIKRIYEKYHKLIIIIIVIILIILGILLNNLDLSEKKEPPIIKKEEDISFYIDIKGEINRPNIYHFNKEIYLYELILMSGGFTNYAKTDNLNLIEIINTNKTIIINKDTYKENKINIIDISTTNNNCLLYFGDLNIYIIDKNTSLYEILWIIDKDNLGFNNDLIIKNTSYIQGNSNNLININTSSINELTKLDKIGVQTAQKIIEYREEHGPFKKIDEIMNVSGIGKATFDLIKDKICI